MKWKQNKRCQWIISKESKKKIRIKVFHTNQTSWAQYTVVVMAIKRFSFVGRNSNKKSFFRCMICFRRIGNEYTNSEFGNSNKLTIIGFEMSMGYQYRNETMTAFMFNTCVYAISNGKMSLIKWPSNKQTNKQTKNKRKKKWNKILFVAKLLLLFLWTI